MASSLLWTSYVDIDGLVQECSISIANVQEILQSCHQAIDISVTKQDGSKTICILQETYSMFGMPFI